MGAEVGFGFGKLNDSYEIFKALKAIAGKRQRFTPREIEAITGGDAHIRSIFGQILSERDAAIEDKPFNRPDIFYWGPSWSPPDWGRDFGFN